MPLKNGCVFSSNKTAEKTTGTVIKHRSLQQVHIQIAIVVIVKERRARSHNLRHKVFARRAGEVLEVQSGFGSGVTEKRLLRKGDRQK